MIFMDWRVGIDMVIGFKSGNFSHRGSGGKGIKAVCLNLRVMHTIFHGQCMQFKPCYVNMKS